MNSEMKNAERDNTDAMVNSDSGNSGPIVTTAQPENMPLSAKKEYVDPAKNRQEKIKKMEARLQRAIARDNAASRKERNGQLFVWGAMVEGVYRDGDAQERDQLRRWAKRKLTDQRHLQRAENGFARIEDEAADKADV